MDEFTMSAFALHRDGRSGDAFAEVHERSLVACFGLMAAAVADWLPGVLAGEAEVPAAVELTLEWSGAGAAQGAPGSPAPPGGPERRLAGPRRGAVRCAPRGRGLIGLAAPVALDGAAP